MIDSTKHSIDVNNKNSRICRKDTQNLQKWKTADSVSVSVNVRYWKIKHPSYPSPGLIGILGWLLHRSNSSLVI